MSSSKHAYCQMQGDAKRDQSSKIPHTSKVPSKGVVLDDLQRSPSACITITMSMYFNIFSSFEMTPTLTIQLQYILSKPFVYLNVSSMFTSSILLKAKFTTFNTVT